MLTVSQVTLSKHRQSRECHSPNVDGHANATLKCRWSHECHLATSSVLRIPPRNVVGLANTTSQRRWSRECHSPNVDGLANATLKSRRSHECHLAMSSVSRMPTHNIVGYANTTLQTSMVSRMPPHNVVGLANATSQWRQSHECYAATATVPRMTHPSATTAPAAPDIDSTDSADINGAGSTGQQRHGQHLTSDSLTPTLRHWENTRSARA